ncbi:ATP synthase F(0) complex subunit B1, mitochondrial-like [Planococcus citri]|uniref:ATP synthase F(0) complex subunit B1, mitochondrial-like n=1 Tax=Planococcus citri TaxID=170843 RepID=UPI0031F9685B
MLSRLSARAIFKPQSFFGLSYARPASTEVVKTEEQPEKPVTQLKADYIPLPSPFHGLERDLVNFPKPVRLENTSPCRMVFIPEEWFKFLYPKLGVAGPYTLGIGIMETLISKEFDLIDDAEFKHSVAKSPLGKMAADLFPTKKEDIVLQREAVYQPNMMKMNLYQQRQAHRMSYIHRRFYSSENDIRYSLKEMFNDVNKTLNELKSANCDSRVKLEEFKTEMIKAYQESQKEFSKEIRETRNSNEKTYDKVFSTYIFSAISAAGVGAAIIRELF